MAPAATVRRDRLCGQRLGVPRRPPPSVGSFYRSAVRVASRRSTREVYSDVIRSLIEANYSVADITLPVVASLCREVAVEESGGRWIVARSATGPDDFVNGYLTPAGCFGDRSLPFHQSEQRSSGSKGEQFPAFPLQWRRCRSFSFSSSPLTSRWRPPVRDRALRAAQSS